LTRHVREDAVLHLNKAGQAALATLVGQSVSELA
jgi:hypothetical protein